MSDRSRWGDVELPKRYGPLERRLLDWNRLHGSLRWAWPERSTPPHRLIVVGRHDARARRYRPAIYFPDGNKLLTDEQRPLAELFSPDVMKMYDPGGVAYPLHLAHHYFARALERANVLLAIGYSFRDPSCLEILRRARHLPRIVLFDPNPDPVVRRIRAAAPHADVRELRGYFGDAALRDAVSAAIA